MSTYVMLLLITADLSEATMAGADMRGADFSSIKFNKDTDFININWGKKFCAVGIPQFTLERTYREIKMWHNEAGMYDIAGEFFYREMTAKRDSYLIDDNIITWANRKEWGITDHWRIQYFKEHLHPLKPKEILRIIFPRKPVRWALSMLFNLVCGYGERPLRVITSATVVVFGLALIYFAIGALTPNTFLNSLYYSAVSFTAVGYGSWVKDATGWVKGLGAFEAFVGVFMIALFLITFVRKMTR